MYILNVLMLYDVDLNTEVLACHISCNCLITIQYIIILCLEYYEKHEYGLVLITVIYCCLQE